MLWGGPILLECDVCGTMERRESNRMGSNDEMLCYVGDWVLDIRQVQV